MDFRRRPLSPARSGELASAARDGPTATTGSGPRDSPDRAIEEKPVVPETEREGGRLPESRDTGGSDTGALDLPTLRRLYIDALESDGPEAGRVYDQVDRAGETTVERLKDQLEANEPGIKKALACLEALGAVERNGRKYQALQEYPGT